MLENLCVRDGAVGTVIGFRFVDDVPITLKPSVSKFGKDASIPTREIPVVLVQFDYDEHSEQDRARALANTCMQGIPNVFPIVALKSESPLTVNSVPDGSRAAGRRHFGQSSRAPRRQAALALARFITALLIDPQIGPQIGPQTCPQAHSGFGCSQERSQQGWVLPNDLARPIFGGESPAMVLTLSASFGVTGKTPSTTVSMVDRCIRVAP